MLGNLLGVLQLVGRLAVAIGSAWLIGRFGHLPSAVSVGMGQLAFYFSFFVFRLPLSKILMLREVESSLGPCLNATLLVSGKQSTTAKGQVSVRIGDLLEKHELDKAARLMQLQKLIKGRDRQFTDLFFNDMIPVVLIVLGGAVFSVVIKMMPNQELGHLGVTAQSPIIALTQSLIGIMPVLFAVGKLYGEITFIRGRAFEVLD